MRPNVRLTERRESNRQSEIGNDFMLPPLRSHELLGVLLRRNHPSSLKKLALSPDLNTSVCAPKRFICNISSALSCFMTNRHPKEMGEAEIRAYLSDLAVNKNVAASTQNVAAALLFLYRDGLHRTLERIGKVERARLPSRLPVVFTKQEASAILSNFI